MSGHWQGSTRRQRLPDDWPQRRATIRARAEGRCEHWGAATRCPNPGTDCDHIHPGDDHSYTNLQWLCPTHHKAKSSAEGNARYLNRKRTPEPHPGLRP